MNDRILVAYATKHGGTAEIAERVARVLREAGLDVDALPAQRAGDPAAYRAVVLGSALYIGRWRREAVRFLEANEAALAARPVWLFCSGPTGEGEPAELLQGWHIPPNMKSLVQRIAPRGVGVFGGALDTGTMSFFEKWIIKRVKAPVGDFRDWRAIEAWAADIAASLKEKG